MKIVLDTNILIVILSRKAKFYPIFKSFLEGNYTLCISNEILSEYREIIARNMGAIFVEYFMEIIDNADNIEWVTTYYRWNLITSDYDDNKFVDCAIACNAKYIVSEDNHFNILKQIPFPKIDVVGIQEFTTLLEEYIK